jgi:hypothetical protein
MFLSVDLFCEGGLLRLELLAVAGIHAEVVTDAGGHVPMNSRAGVQRPARLIVRADVLVHDEGLHFGFPFLLGEEYQIVY